ncbi:hypothetical protein LUZ60_012009 [Juncus effusus]|nr:hypothetical protein LUZ60_012009 [Juncus effusus]
MALGNIISVLSVSHGRHNLPPFRRSRVSLVLPRAVKSDPVEVIGIGSRKDAVIDYCLSSLSLSSSFSRLRFWTIHARDSSKVQLIERSNSTNVKIKDLEFPLSLLPLPPTLVLVASTGHGSDHITATGLLNSVKSKGNLAVSIIVRPFNFEGQRRQQEADELIRKLQECSNFHIVIEADSLLKTEAETLSEALENANNTVFLSVSMISAMTSSGSHLMLESSPNEPIKEITLSKFTKLLEKYKEARVGFGAGYNARSAIKQAVFNTPFLHNNIKGLNGIIFMTITSSSLLDEKSDLIPLLHIFRRIMEFNGEIIYSNIYEPRLEPNLVIITLLIVGSEQIRETKEGFLSGLASRIPFISSFMKINWNLESERNEENEKYTINNLSTFENLEKELDTMESDSESILEINEQTNGDFETESNFWNFGPRFHMAKQWAQREINFSNSTTNKTDGIDVFTLPVGVKSSENPLPYFDDSQNAPDGEVSADGSLGAFWEICNSAVDFVKGRTNVVEPRKQGSISSRAASMLEIEREREKTWSPVVKIEYRGGKYKGRCQGGLPEGKGNLTFEDGSFYEGMWRNGKRFGVGTMYYSNGDVFHGTWRDDLMHGKGWYYFRKGDRWFVNFWKGRANGEGRFYSKNGNIFFGNFQNGWRHGRFLNVDANGSRWDEVWDEGVLVSRTKLQN